MKDNDFASSTPTFGFEWAPELAEAIQENLGKISCMEIIPENFFEGRFNQYLEMLGKAGTPVAVHGVLLSIGSADPLKEKHLDQVLEIAARVNMVNFSEHLSMTEVAGVDLDALTPIPQTVEMLDTVCKKIDLIQKRLKVPFLIENVSNRFVIADTDYRETEFINKVIEKTGCGLLLDVTNVYTNSVNFGFDSKQWLDEINLRAVGVVHLAGGDFDPDGFLMDSHDNTVALESWELYEDVCRRASSFMTIIERTGNFPRFESLMTELAEAKRVSSRARRKRDVTEKRAVGVPEVSP